MTTPLFFKMTEADHQHRTISVFDTLGEYAKVVDDSHPYFQAILEALIENPQDAEKIKGLIDPVIDISKALSEISDRVAADRNGIYIDGVKVHGKAAQYTVDMIQRGESDWGRFVRFLLSLWENPSPLAQEAVWEWVQKHGVTIADDGRIIGFKGLVMGTDLEGNRVPVSYRSGPNNFINGVLYGETGISYQVPHVVGTVISKRRADVDEDNAIACSTGLHVGAYDYAKTFGENRQDGYQYSTMGKMASTFALVAFEAGHVVSVPGSDSDWKIRVEKYEVVEFLDRVENVLKDMPSYTYATKPHAPFLPKGQEPTPEASERFAATEEEPVEVEASSVTQEEVDQWEHADEEVHPEELSEEDDTEVEKESSDEEADLDQIAGEEGAAGAPLPRGEHGFLVPATDKKPTLADWALANPVITTDLVDPTLGHKAVARKYKAITTEASVRRWRKNNGVDLNLRAKVLGR